MQTLSTRNNRDSQNALENFTRDNLEMKEKLSTQELTISQLESDKRQLSSENDSFKSSLSEEQSRTHTLSASLRETKAKLDQVTQLADKQKTDMLVLQTETKNQIDKLGS